MITVLGISGSVRPASHTRLLVEFALEAAAESGAQTHLIDLHTKRLPLYEPRQEDILPIITEVREKIAAAEAIIVGTPEYHGSMSGALKNLLDYLFPEVDGKLLGFIVSSGTDSGTSALAELREVAMYLHAWTLPYGVTTSLPDFNEDGQLISHQVREKLRRMGRDMAWYGEVLYRAR